MFYDELETPIGGLLLVGDEAGLRRIHFQSGRHPMRPDPVWRQDPAPFRALAGQLREYFARERRAFDLPLTPEGTPFQLATWQALTQIPYGQTISYVELARRVGRPSAARAVGAANGANPLPIVVPCHRVIAAGGKLGGFSARGGVTTKLRLLGIEGARVADQLTLFEP